MKVQTISVEAFGKVRNLHPNLFMIDVRTPAEHATCHVDGVRLFPLQGFDTDTVIAAADGTDQIFILCKSGGRAMKAAEQLARATDKSIFVVEGGTDACDASGMPVNRGRETMSLERQVRIAAGSLVLLGVVLGALVHPWFVGLSAFVGAGLVFAGLTDTCAMGMMLARMPWNNTGGTNPGANATQEAN